MPDVKVILFQGDSITDTLRNREQAVVNSCWGGLGHGYPLLTAARLLAEQPQAGLQFYNRGISGNRVVDLYARWKVDALNLKPDLISILIGINDIWHEKMHQNGVELNRFAQIYRMLLEWTREVLPDVRLVLMEPFALPCGVVEDSWMQEVAEQSEVVRQLAKDFQAGFVETQKLLLQAAKTATPEYYLEDGVHPTSAGHQLLAEAWLAEVRKQGFLK